MCFLRTVLLHRHLALYVHTLDIRGWSVNFVIGVPNAHSKNILHEYLTLFEAVLSAFIFEPRNFNNYYKSMSLGIDEVFMALLIISLPNLQNLYMVCH